MAKAKTKTIIKYVKKAKKRTANKKISVLSMLHMLPGFGQAIAGNSNAGLGGALAFAKEGNIGGAVQEFGDVLTIAYTGIKPSDGSKFWDRGYPFTTYAAHAGIEIGKRVTQHFLRKSFKFGPFKFP